MKKLLYLILFLLIPCVIFAAVINDNVTGPGFGIFSGGSFFGASSSSSSEPAPEEGFLLLETSGDKLLLETGVTDALLLEG